MFPKIHQRIPSPKYILTLISYEPKFESGVFLKCQFLTISQLRKKRIIHIFHILRPPIWGIYFLELFQKVPLKGSKLKFSLILLKFGDFLDILWVYFEKSQKIRVVPNLPNKFWLPLYKIHIQVKESQNVKNVNFLLIFPFWVIQGVQK